jgi:hypothetical protein
MGTRLDDWIQLQSIIIAHKTHSIPYWTTSVFSSTVTNYKWRLTCDWTELSFCNFEVNLIYITISNSSSITVSIHCHGYVFLVSCCLAMLIFVTLFSDAASKIGLSTCVREKWILVPSYVNSCWLWYASQLYCIDLLPHLPSPSSFILLFIYSNFFMWITYEPNLCIYTIWSKVSGHPSVVVNWNLHVTTTTLTGIKGGRKLCVTHY